MESLITKTIEIAESNGLAWFGIRHHHKKVSIGDELGNSCNYLDDQPVEELNGVCCISIDSAEDFNFIMSELSERNYQTGSVILVGGTAQEFGNDDNEVIIENPEILLVIK